MARQQSSAKTLEARRLKLGCLLRTVHKAQNHPLQDEPQYHLQITSHHQKQLFSLQPVDSDDAAHLAAAPYDIHPDHVRTHVAAPMPAPRDPPYSSRALLPSPSAAPDLSSSLADYVDHAQSTRPAWTWMRKNSRRPHTPSVRNGRTWKTPAHRNTPFPDLQDVPPPRPPYRTTRDLFANQDQHTRNLCKSDFHSHPKKNQHIAHLVALCSHKLTLLLAPLHSDHRQQLIAHVPHQNSSQPAQATVHADLQHHPWASALRQPTRTDRTLYQ